MAKRSLIRDGEGNIVGAITEFRDGTVRITTVSGETAMPDSTKDVADMIEGLKTRAVLPADATVEKTGTLKLNLGRRG